MVLRERNATPEDLPVVELFWDGFQNGAKDHPTGISRLQMIGPIEALQVPTFQIEFYIVPQIGVVAIGEKSQLAILLASRKIQSF